MAPLSRLVVMAIVLMCFVACFAQLKDNVRKRNVLSSSSTLRGRSSSRARVRRTYSGGSNTRYSGGGIRAGSSLTWWHILLIASGSMGVIGAVIYCYIYCKNQEPESDTPGLEAPGDAIALRNHRTLDRDDVVGGGYRPIPQTPTIPRGTATKSTGSSTTATTDHVTAPPTAEEITSGLPPPPSYDEALSLEKRPHEEVNGCPDKWEDFQVGGYPKCDRPYENQ